jgi:hypothetical protein
MPNTLPPLDAAAVRVVFDGTRTAYLYIGAEGDAGWAIAQAVAGMLAALEIFLVTDPTRVQEWEEGHVGCKGIAFGFDGVPRVFLEQSETGDLQRVLAAVTTARR